MVTFDHHMTRTVVIPFNLS